MLQKHYGSYKRYYSDSWLFNKIASIALKVGKKLVYIALLLYYTLQKDNVPFKAKAVILGTLGYFICPFDVVPDFLPIVGYSDDLGALMMALLTVAMYIDNEVKAKAKMKLTGWFSDYTGLDEVDARL